MFFRPSIGLRMSIPSTKSFFDFKFLMKFGMYIEVDEWCTTVCSMTRSKVKFKVTSPLKFEIRLFSKAISYPSFTTEAGNWPQILKLGHNF